MAESKHGFTTTTLEVRKYVDSGGGSLLSYAEFGRVVMGPVRDCLVYETRCECHTTIYTSGPELIQFEKKLTEPKQDKDDIFRAHTKHRLSLLEENRG